MISLLLTAALGLANIEDARTPRGISGSITITHTGEPLQAKLDQDLSSPLLIRVTDLTPTADATSEHRYRVDYIGVVAGNFDLRTLIMHRDGTTASDIAPIPVTIVSELPEKFSTDLYTVAAQPIFARSYYRIIIAIIAVIWIGIPIVVLIRRAIKNRPAQAAPPAAAPPTLADQLRPLVEAAMNAGLSIEEQARLELLLMAFWSQRRNLDSLSPAQAIEQLRTDPQARGLLLAVEEWLHARGNQTPRPASDLARLLEPYRQHAVINMVDPVR